MRERVITFGNEKNLVGVLTEPDESHEVKDVPCVLILNAGILHHVGPFRLHVVTARHLAAEGYMVFRLDVAGIGDSVPIKGAGYDESSVISDIRMAMDELRNKKGISDFVLMGLCTGAANAHKAAVADDRVKGAVFLDGYAYPTWRFYIKRYLPVLMDPVRVKNAILRMVRHVVGKSATNSQSVDKQEGFGWWILPPKKEVQEDFVSLVDRGVNLLYIYSGEESEVYNYPQQLQHAFSSINFNGRLKVIINDEADHTYIMAEDRDKLTRLVTDWLNECYR
jgi:pimeloyl-ACP methyl ester carboxylesterase